MAQIPKPTRKTSCFPTFSRFCGKFPIKKSCKDPRSDNRKESRCGFSWSRFRVKKSAAKTVPVDASVPEKANRNDEIRPEKAENLRSTSQNSGACHGTQVALEKTAKTRYGTAQSITPENRKHLDRLDSSKGATCHEKRKLESKRSRLSQPSSPENISVTTSPAAPMARSVSFPAPRRQKQPALRFENPPRDGKLAGKADSVIAMTIIMVTLAMMVICGRLFAILFTSAWFYFVPYLRSGSKSNESVNSDFDDRSSNSEEVKKKVILEGFLERNHRTPIGILL
ncbi:hypothetical protein PVL29_000181 [Vitis rotundifolia]|uniref:Uncharacterized protein n=1 Tax=Vitis rotundifolia TaxID=103349 RepID=A0AA39E4D0_VITRO|nr:hypothetical protein PVL29_000181 [Vitis rotundifolia]